jgi:hypothetical protein
MGPQCLPSTLVPPPSPPTLPLVLVLVLLSSTSRGAVKMPHMPPSLRPNAYTAPLRVHSREWKKPAAQEATAGSSVHAAAPAPAPAPAAVGVLPPRHSRVNPRRHPTLCTGCPACPQSLRPVAQALPSLSTRRLWCCPQAMDTTDRGAQRVEGGEGAAVQAARAALAVVGSVKLCCGVSLERAAQREV